MLWNDILQKCAEQHWCKHSVTEKHSLLDKYKTLGTHGMKDKDRGLCLFHWKSLKSTKHIFLSCYCKNAVIEVVSTSRSSEGKFIARGKTRCSLLISSPLLLYPLASWQIGNKTQPVTFKACLSFTRQHMEPPPPTHLPFAIIRCAHWCWNRIFGLCHFWGRNPDSPEDDMNIKWKIHE